MSSAGRSMPAFRPSGTASNFTGGHQRQRVDFRPDVPTMKESGFGVVGGTWNAIFGPAHMPPAIVDKLNAGCIGGNEIVLIGLY